MAEEDQTSDLDGASAPDTMRSIVEALLFFEDQLRGEIRFQRERADSAEDRLARAESEIDSLRHEVLQSGAATRQIAYRLTEGLQEFLEETEQAQKSLIAITRHLLASGLSVQPEEPEADLPVNGEWPQAAVPPVNDAVRAGGE